MTVLLFALKICTAEYELGYGLMFRTQTQDPAIMQSPSKCCLFRHWTRWLWHV